MATELGDRNAAEAERPKHPADKLPRDRGPYRYKPPEEDVELGYKRDHDGMFLDHKDNRWKFHRSNNTKGLCEHWDVQHPNGRHSNIDPDGHQHHRRVHEEFF